MKVSKELLKGTSELIILTVLESGTLYGYEISKQIKLMSEGVFAMGEGSLYPLLHKLEKAKLLESFWKEVDGRRRKYYSITRTGKKVLSEKSEEWQTFSGAVDAIVLA